MSTFSSRHRIFPPQGLGMRLITVVSLWLIGGCVGAPHIQTVSDTKDAMKSGFYGAAYPANGMDIASYGHGIGGSNSQIVYVQSGQQNGYSSGGVDSKFVDSYSGGGGKSTGTHSRGGGLAPHPHEHHHHHHHHYHRAHPNDGGHGGNFASAEGLDSANGLADIGHANATAVGAGASSVANSIVSPITNSNAVGIANTGATGILNGIGDGYGHKHPQFAADHHNAGVGSGSAANSEYSSSASTASVSPATSSSACSQSARSDAAWNTGIQVNGAK